MIVRESEEMYLETILVLKNANKRIRSIDIANELGYSRPSVSRAVSLLVNNGYITISSNGEIEFTEKGQKKAEDVYERHQIITRVLISLGAEEKLAEENACRIEHVIDEELMIVLKKYLNL